MKMMMMSDDMPKKKIPYSVKRKVRNIVLTQEEIKDLGNKYKMLSSEEIVAYIMRRSTRLDNLIERKKTLIMTDYALYEAVSSLRGSVELSLDRLKLLLWNVIIIPGTKTEINRERMNFIRSIAFSGKV